MGLAALQVCKMIGARIFCTVDVSNEDKVRYLVNECDIPRDHIFSSRDTSFVAGVLLGSERPWSGRRLELSCRRAAS